MVNRAPDSDRFSFVGFLSKDLGGNINLQNLAKHATEKWGIRGSGSPVLVRGGGTMIPQNFETQVEEWVKLNFI